MLNFVEVRVRRGARVLVEAASFGVFRGDRVGIVGRNGCGKSSLLALVRGEIAPDAGEYRAPAGLRISSVAQELPQSAQPLIEYVLDGDLELREVERAATEAAARGDGVREARLRGEFESMGGYAARSRAATMLDGLGFAPADIERPLDAFSGGLRMRANLAHALARRADLLLLDEPTNHLDLDALLWLERFLRSFGGTLLIVSHDREFLDAVVGRIVHIEAGAARIYEGNYSAFEIQHAAERERASALAERQRREAERVHAFVERFRAKASKAPQVQSRLKWLARLERIAILRDAESFSWEFAPPARLPRPLVALAGAGAGYGGRGILAGVSLAIAPGDRLGVLGRNGAGKSTLMKLLAGTLEPEGGEIVRAPDLAAGFFAQLEIEQLDACDSPLAELERRGGEAVAGWSTQQRRDHLGRFGFRAERVFEPIERFSGGERARLALAILVARRPNLLLLDEPANHLDMSMREALIFALQEFPGAVVIVSHDRALLRGVCDRFVLVHDGGLEPFEGDLEDYAALLARTTRADAGAMPLPTVPSRRAERRLEAETRSRLAPLRAQLRAIEQRLEALGTRRTIVERELADPGFYATHPPEVQRARAQEHVEIGRDIERAEEHWLSLSERLDAETANPMPQSTRAGG